MSDADTTRWSAQGSGFRIRYDPDASVTVGSLAIARHQRYQRRASSAVQVSADAGTWNTLISQRQIKAYDNDS